MSAKIDPELPSILRALGDEILGFVYAEANEDGAPELAVALGGPPNDVMMRLMMALDFPVLVTGSLFREGDRLVLSVPDGEWGALAEHLPLFAAQAPELAGADLRAGDGPALDEDEPEMEEEEQGPEGELEILDEPEMEEEAELEPAQEAPAPVEQQVQPVPQASEPQTIQAKNIESRSIPPSPASLSDRVNAALQSAPQVRAATDAFLAAHRALDAARLPQLATLSALDAARARFTQAVGFVRSNTSVNAMKEAMRSLEGLAAVERAAAPAKRSVEAPTRALAEATAALHRAVQAASAQDPAFAAVMVEGAHLLPWTRVEGVADPVPAEALGQAISHVLGASPTVREGAKRYRNVAQSRAWPELVPLSLVGVVAPIRQASAAGQGHPQSGAALDAVLAGLPALADALGAARHARTWADKLPPEKRQVAEGNQSAVTGECAAWLELAAALAVMR